LLIFTNTFCYYLQRVLSSVIIGEYVQVFGPSRSSWSGYLVHANNGHKYLTKIQSFQSF